MIYQVSISIKIYIALLSLNIIEIQSRCGLKSVFSGEVHSRKRKSSYDGRWMLRLVVSRSNVKRCVFIFFRIDRKLSDHILRERSHFSCV